MQWLINSPQYQGENGTGACEQKIMILYNGEKNLRVKVEEKKEDGSVIADIPFQIPIE